VKNPNIPYIEEYTEYDSYVCGFYEDGLKKHLAEKAAEGWQLVELEFLGERQWRITLERFIKE